MQQKFWTIGGGKGGVGKSFLTASMGAVLAREGKSVIVVDADLGSANLHTYVGIKDPAYSLMDILEDRASAEDVLIPTGIDGLRLLSCAGDILGMADPEHARKERIIDFISSLDADYILVDLGAGTSYNVLDFFNMSDEGIVVAAPDPASIQNAYAFIKTAIYRRIQRRYGEEESVREALRRFGEGNGKPRTMMAFYELLCTSSPEVAEKVSELVDSYRPLIVINMAGSPGDQRVAEIIQSASRRFLNVDIGFCGLVSLDPVVRRSIQRMTFLDFEDPRGVASRQIRDIVDRLLNYSEEEDAGVPAGSGRNLPATPTMGLNDNLEFMGRQLHIQTEDLGYTGRCITTQVFCDGRVLLSTRSEYPSSVQDQSGRGRVAELMRKQHFEVIRDLESRKAPQSGSA